MSESPYSWRPSSGASIDDFLKKNKPSMVVDDGTKPWIWVRRVEQEPLDEETGENTRIEQAKALLDQYTERIAAIQKDDSIPVRSNKKKGLRSKKEVREEVMAEAASEFKRISKENNLTCGKWLFFAASEHIDALWERLAHDLVAGALSKTPAFCAKVSSTPSNVEPHHRYIICLYLPDLYDKDAATEVLRTVCQSVGVRPNGAKPDLYTTIGLDSKHASGMKSTIWNPHDLIPESELKLLVDNYWASANKKDAKTDAPDDELDAPHKPKKKSIKPKRKAEDSDDEHIFDEVDITAMDDTTSTGKAKINPTSNPKPKVSAPSKPTGSAPDDSATESESDGPPTAPSPVLNKGHSASANPVDGPKADGSSSEDEAVKRPKKVRRF